MDEDTFLINNHEVTTREIVNNIRKSTIRTIG
jgi:hypothetical protein